MLTISDDEIFDSLGVENPWWNGDPRKSIVSKYPKRTYFRWFRDLAVNSKVRRSLILLGPRRVGKTVMLHQLIDELIANGTIGSSILYASLDRPLYNGLSLERIVKSHLEKHDNHSPGEFWFLFDEVQYLRDWERELKSLTDIYTNCRFIVSGSAAAALRAKSRESGAGRFTEFMLPPLTFDEFILFQEKRNEQYERLCEFADSGFAAGKLPNELDITFLNILFENYLTYGGYPEAVFAEEIQDNLDRFVRDDIVEKVLLRDLPTLYGISDTRELYSLFTTLCYNTAQEVSLEALSQSSNVAKNTIKRYLEYLEAAFLIGRVRRIDNSARQFQRQTTFKVYLTNPSLRAALFRPVSKEDDLFGHLAETAVFSQWFHSPPTGPFHYARWASGEIDMVNLQARGQRPDWFAEIKWSDRHLTRNDEWAAIAEFVNRHKNSLRSGIVTSRSKFAQRNLNGLGVEVVPTAIYAWQVGRNTVRSRGSDVLDLDTDEPTLFDELD